MIKPRKQGVEVRKQGVEDQAHMIKPRTITVKCDRKDSSLKQHDMLERRLI